jgi:PAS domain S-box-containing protein
MEIPVGTWEWNLENGNTYWSNGVYELLGLARGEGAAHVNDFVRFIHPDDRQRVLSDVESAIKRGNDYYAEFRIVRDDGAIVWLSSKGCLVRGASGAGRMIGVNIDITERKRAEQALHESQERLRSAFDHATIGMALVAIDGRLLQVNRSYCKLLGYSEQELLATNFQSLTHPGDLHDDLTFRRQLLAGERNVFQMEKRYIHKSGHTVWGLLNISLMRNGVGRPLYFISQIQDVTERKRVEMRLAIQHAVSRILSEAALMADAAPRLLQAICEPLGYELGEVWVPDHQTGQLIMLDCWSQASDELMEFASASRQFTFYPDVGLPGRIWKSCRASWITHLVNDSDFQRPSLAQAAGLTSGFGFPALVADRTVAILVFFSREVRERDEDLLRLTLSLGDQIGQFAERKQAEEALRRSEEALRESHARIEDLAGRLIAAQEEERKHFARELHDDLNQQVAALAIGISRLKQALPDSDAGVQEQVVRLRKDTDRLSERIRRMSHEWHSSVLQHVGLPAALISYCDEFSEQEGIAVSLAIHDGVEAVPPDAALCLYRVAQESLRNVARHSGARKAVVELMGTEAWVELQVIDRGAGFDPDTARGRGLGLVSIEERVRLLHGSLVLRARPGEGTEVKARIPSRAKHEQDKRLAG